MKYRRYYAIRNTFALFRGLSYPVHRGGDNVAFIREETRGCMVFIPGMSVTGYGGNSIPGHATVQGEAKVGEEQGTMERLACARGTLRNSLIGYLGQLHPNRKLRENPLVAKHDIYIHISNAISTWRKNCIVWDAYAMQRCLLVVHSVGV